MNDITATSPPTGDTGLGEDVVRRPRTEDDAPGSEEPRSGPDKVSIEALFPSRDIRLVIDQATGIVQAEVRDAATGRVLRMLPDADWLKVVRALRAFASEAILDRKA